MACVKATDLVLGEVQIVPSFAEAPLLLAQRTLGGEVSRLSFPFATSETRVRTGAEICPAVVSGIVTGDAPVSYWSIFFPVPSNSLRSLRKLTRPSFLLVSKAK